MDSLEKRKAKRRGPRPEAQMARMVVENARRRRQSNFLFIL